MLVQAILIGLIAMFVTFEWMFGTNLGSRPIITGMLVGLVMGDLKTGIILGATLEMVFIGSITLGAAVPPDVITGGVLGAAFAISTGKGADVALALAFPIATLYLVVDNVLTLGILPFFLGHNGHIGFNEPAEVFVKQTHCVSLSEKTIQANQRFFESKEQVPKQAYTMGIGTIRSARKILINY